MAISLRNEIIEMIYHGPDFLMENCREFSARVEELILAADYGDPISRKEAVFSNGLLRLKEELMVSAPSILCYERSLCEKLEMESLVQENLWLLEDGLRINAASIAAFSKELENTHTAEQKEELQANLAENITSALHKRHSIRVLQLKGKSLHEEIECLENQVESCKILRESIEEEYEKVVTAVSDP